MRVRGPLIAFIFLTSACTGASLTTNDSAGASARLLHATAGIVAPNDRADFGKETPASRREMAAQASPQTPPQLPGAGPMLVRSGRASLQVDSLDTGIARVRDLARRVGAALGNTSVQSGREQLKSATLELRVPSDRFDDLVAGLRTLGTVDAVDVTVADVGEEFVDVTARVATSRQLERRLIDLLATATGKLADVLHVERELARVREEIERYEGRLRYLRERSAVSILAITVHEPIPVLGDRPGSNPIAEALRQAWRNFVTFLAACIAALGIVIPVGALVAGAIVAGRRWLPRGKPAADAA